MKIKPLIIAVCASLLTAVNLLAAAPTIITQPVGKTIGAGTNYTLFVKASTNATGYLWYKGTNATSVTTTNYTITGATASDSTNYTVVVTNSADSSSITSAVATVTVLNPVAMSAGLVSTNIGLGTNLTLSVTVSGSSPTYIWKKNTAVLSDTDNTCVVDSSVAGTFKYIVTVTNAVSASISSTATVSVVSIPVISKNLTNKYLAVGSNYTFTVTGTNTMGTYKWFFNATNALSSATNSYTLSTAAPANGGAYSVVLSNLAGCITSAVSTVTIQKYPAITNVLKFGTNAAAGTNYAPVGAALAMSVAADGDTLSYQWQKDGRNVSGTTATNSISSAALTNSGKYTVIVSNNVGKVTSSNLVLTVIGPPTIKTAPIKKTQLAGTTLTLTVSAAGTAPYTNLWYQWTLASTNITAATNATLTITNAGTYWSGNYSVIITNFGGATTSAPVAITIAADTKAPAITFTLPSKSLTNASYTLVGTAKDTGNVPVTNVWCFLNLGTNAPDLTNTSAYATTTNAFAKWTKDLTLVPGTNFVAAVASDINGNFVTNTAKIVYAPIFDATLTTNGYGKITGWTNKVQYGTYYTLTAKPDARNLFINWSGVSGIVTTNSTNSVTFKFTPTNTVTLAVNFATNKFFYVVGDYNGLFYKASGVALDSAGSFKLTVTTNLTYSGKALYNGKTVSLSGSLDTNGVGSNSLASGIAMKFGIGSLQLTGAVSSATWTSVLSADINYFSKTNPATNYSGTYTLVIPPATNGPATNGYGYGIATVSTNGTVTFAGATADGTAISQTAPISKDGYFPLFVQMYTYQRTNTAGALGGWLNFRPNSVAPTGAVFWVKTPAYTNSAIYAAGLTNITDIQSSKFTAPTKANPKALPGMVMGTVDMVGGNLTNSISEYLLMANDGAVYSTDPTLQVRMAASGLVTGKVTHNATRKSISFAGVVLQNNTNAFGYFLGTNSTGSVLIDGTGF